MSPVDDARHLHRRGAVTSSMLAVTFIFGAGGFGATSSCSSRRPQPGVVEALGPHPAQRAKLRPPVGFDQSSQEARAIFRHRREEVRRTLVDAAAARAHLSVIEARIEREKDAD